MRLDDLAQDFARGLEAADALRPQSKRYAPGIGPHDEPTVVRLVLDQMRIASPAAYATARTEVPYSTGPERCDLCIGEPDVWSWAIEIKAARAKRNNGDVEPTYIKDIISPYPEDRSALTDATKILSFGLPGSAAIMLYAYDYGDRPVLPLMNAFERLLECRVNILDRAEAPFDGLVHPHHQRGLVMAWALAS